MNLPVTQLIEKINKTLNKYPNSDIFVKFTCIHCGSRQTFSEPNTIFADGVCEDCGQTTKITCGGFALNSRIG